LARPRTSRDDDGRCGDLSSVDREALRVEELCVPADPFDAVLLERVLHVEVVRVAHAIDGTKEVRHLHALLRDGLEDVAQTPRRPAIHGRAPAKDLRRETARAACAAEARGALDDGDTLSEVRRLDRRLLARRAGADDGDVESIAHADRLPENARGL